MTLHEMACNLAVESLLPILGVNMTAPNRYGNAAEMLIKAFLNFTDCRVSAQNEPDIIFSGVEYEVKTGSGTLSAEGNEPIPNCDYVVYIPHVDETVSLRRQEGFVIAREKFLRIMNDLHLIRWSKNNGRGGQSIGLQTIWNRKQGKPHSLKTFTALLDALYEQSEMTLDEWLILNA